MLCLCAGTPVQNNLRELYGLMNLLDNAAYPDEADFFAKFGGDNGPPTIDQIKALQVPRPPTVLSDPFHPTSCFSVVMVGVQDAGLEQ